MESYIPRSMKDGVSVEAYKNAVQGVVAAAADFRDNEAGNSAPADEMIPVTPAHPLHQAVMLLEPLCDGDHLPYPARQNWYVVVGESTNNGDVDRATGGAAGMVDWGEGELSKMPDAGHQPCRKWTPRQIEEAVYTYVSNRIGKYKELVLSVLETGSIKRFQDVFGPTAIERECGCDKRRVQETATHQAMIAPLFRKPPYPPTGWTPPDHDTSARGDTLANLRNRAKAEQ